MKKKVLWRGIVRATIPFIFATFLISLLFQSCQKDEMAKSENLMLKSATVSGPLTFFTTPEEFPCAGLPTEDFEEAFGETFPCSTNPIMIPPLDENTNNGIFASGDILPGIRISSPIGTELWASAPCFIPDLQSKAVFLNQVYKPLTVEFTENNVTSMSMNIMCTYPPVVGTTAINVEIFGSSGSLGTTTIYTNQAGIYFGVQSLEPITSIVLTPPESDESPNVSPGVDNIAFGSCITDTDGDGCSDSDDAVVNSNMEEFVDIGGCSNGVPNKMTLGETCGTMMSDMIDVLETGTYKNSGAFVKAVGHLAETWVNSGLITPEEKELIVQCAAESSIGSKK